jgi:hypothetical protein
MRRTMLKRAARYVPETDMITYKDSRRSLNFRPHCFVQSLALVESKRFDDAIALAHASQNGDEL